jgi:3-deoxy-7-phosphoheptulonate synthase/chorismate mutase
MVEVHPNPSVAMSDAKQQLSIPQFKTLMAELKKIHVDKAETEAAAD